MNDIQDLTTVSRSIRVEGSGDEVFRALSEQSALTTWFAEHIDIEPRAGGRFAFWGRWTFSAPDRAQAAQTLEIFDPSGTVAIRWNLKSVDTVLRFEWTAGDGDTELRITHELPGNTDRHLHWLALDGIEILLYNLKAYVEEGKPLCMPNYSGSSDTMQAQIAIHATPGDVFSALTQPGVMDRWIASGASVDLRPGGVYSFGWTDDIEGSEVPAGPAQVLDVQEGRLLAHDWTWPREVPTQVRWEISGEGGSTTLTLTHSGFGPQSDVPGYVQGWTSYLCKLKSMLEGLDQPQKAELANASS